MIWQEWLCLFGAGTIGYQASQWASINFLGNPKAYYAHWMAYGMRKSANRWEGRQILAKRPMMY